MLSAIQLGRVCEWTAYSAPKERSKKNNNFAENVGSYMHDKSTHMRTTFNVFIDQ